MSDWYKTKNCECKVLHHLEGHDIISYMGGTQYREKVSDKVAGVVERMLEIAYLAGKDHVREQVKAKLGLGE